MTLTELSAALEKQLSEVTTAGLAHVKATAAVTETARRYEEAVSHARALQADMTAAVDKALGSATSGRVRGA